MAKLLTVIFGDITFELKSPYSATIHKIDNVMRLPEETALCTAEFLADGHTRENSFIIPEIFEGPITVVGLTPEISETPYTATLHMTLHQKAGAEFEPAVVLDWLKEVLGHDVPQYPCKVEAVAFEEGHKPVPNPYEIPLSKFRVFEMLGGNRDTAEALEGTVVTEAERKTFNIVVRSISDFTQMLNDEEYPANSWCFWGYVE